MQRATLGNRGSVTTAVQEQTACVARTGASQAAVGRDREATSWGPGTICASSGSWGWCGQLHLTARRTLLPRRRETRVRNARVLLRSDLTANSEAPLDEASVFLAVSLSDGLSVVRSCFVPTGRDFAELQRKHGFGFAHHKEKERPEGFPWGSEWEQDKGTSSTSLVAPRSRKQSVLVNRPGYLRTGSRPFWPAGRRT